MNYVCSDPLKSILYLLFTVLEKVSKYKIFNLTCSNKKTLVIVDLHNVKIRDVYETNTQSNLS